HATAPPATSTLSLHDALPISGAPAFSTERSACTAWPGVNGVGSWVSPASACTAASSPGCSRRPSSAALSEIRRASRGTPQTLQRSEEHTSELQSLTNLVCRLL